MDTDTTMVDADPDYIKEVPGDVGATSVPAHRQHYEKSLLGASDLPLDCCRVVADFLVFPYLKTGDLVDVRWSSDSRWWVGLVVKSGVQGGNQMIEIHYLGWSTRWREWFSRDCADIQPHETRTRGHMRVGSLVKEYGASAVDPLAMAVGQHLLYEDYLCTLTRKDMECVPPHVRLNFGASKIIWVPVGQRDSKFKKIYESDNWVCVCGHRNLGAPTFYCVNCGCSFHVTLPSRRRSSRHQS